MQSNPLIKNSDKLIKYIWKKYSDSYFNFVLNDIEDFILDEMEITEKDVFCFDAY